MFPFSFSSLKKNKNTPRGSSIRVFHAIPCRHDIPIMIAKLPFPFCFANPPFPPHNACITHPTFPTTAGHAQCYHTPTSQPVNSESEMPLAADVPSPRQYRVSPQPRSPRRNQVQYKSMWCNSFNYNYDLLVIRIMIIS